MKIAEDSPKANSSAGLTEVSYTIILSDRPLAKRFSVKNGAPVKLSGDAVLTAGIAARRTARGSPTEMLAAFGGDLERMGSSNVLVLAAPPPGHDRWPVVTRDGLDSSPGAIARTDEYFHARPGPGIGGLDHDVRDFPPHVMARLLLSSDDVDKAIADALAAACPQLSEAASLVRRSASTGVRARLTGVETDPNGGLHRFYVANEATGYAGFVASLAERLMLNGWLWGSISKNGTVLFRTLIDVGASKNLGRLWYEGPVILESDQLEYVPERRRPTITPGTFLSTQAVAPLDKAERERLDAMRAEIRLKLAPEAAAVRDAWQGGMRKRVPPAASRGDIGRTFVQAAERNELSGSFPIKLDDGRTIVAREILAAPAAFHRNTCADPLEWGYNGGRNIAIIFSDNSQVRIESLAHGGRTFRVTPDPADWFEPQGGEAGNGADTDGNEADPSPRDIFADGDANASLDIPSAALPPIVERWAKDVSERIGAPPAFAAVSALAVFSGAIGAKLKIQPKALDSAWREPAFLWFGIVEAPGGKKSPTIAQAVAPLLALDSQNAREGGEAWNRWAERKRLAKRGEVFIEPEPKIRRYATDSFTLEALAGILADNPAGVMVVADEITGLIGQLDQYKGGRGSDRAMLLRLFDGREARVDRVGRKNVYIPTWGAAALGGIQPRRIMDMAKDLDSDGLLQRFILVWSDGEYRQGVDREPDEVAVRVYEAAVRQIAEANFGKVSPAVRLSDEAQAMWRKLSDRIGALAHLPGLSDAWRGHLGKWPGFAARLLLVCHVIEHTGDGLGSVDTTPVSADTARRAARLVDWLLLNSIRFYALCGFAGEASDDAKWIAGHILSSGKRGVVTRRDLGQLRDDFRKDPSRIERAMRVLEVSDWCVPAERQTNRQGAAWTICPAVHDGRFSSRAESERTRRRRARELIEAAAAERRAIEQGEAA